MKKVIAASIIVTLLVVAAAVYAQQNKPNQEVPEGMEAVQIGGSGWLIIPKGAKTRKVGAQIIVEGVREYMSRRFEETESRLEKIETALANLTAEVEGLRSAVESREAPIPEPAKNQ